MSKSIGIFDSGHGGLDILQFLSQAHPDWNFHYVADLLVMPYGNKPLELIQKRCHEIIHWFEQRGCDAVVMACNTATAMAIDKMREEFSLPIIGIEPYLNYINKAPEKDFQNERLGALVTPNTFESQRFKSLLELRDPLQLVKVETIFELAPLVESLISNRDLPQFKERLLELLSPLKKYRWREVILGCTHYPLIGEFIEEVLEAKCISPTEYVAAQLENRLQWNRDQRSPTSSNTAAPTIKDQEFEYRNTLTEKWEYKKISDFLFWRYS